MEVNKKKRIYFIFSQSLAENIPYQLEKTELIDDIEILNQGKAENYSYSLYSISLNNDLNLKSISLLLNTQNEFFLARIDCDKVYPEIFIYKIEFKPMNKNSTIYLNQIILPVSEQFYIFKSQFINNNNSIKYLLLNSFDFIAISNKKIKFEFYFFLFLFGNSLNLNIENSEDKMISTFFNIFELDSIDVKNSYKKNYLKNNMPEILGTNMIEMFSDINMIYTLIFSLISDEDKNKENEIINLVDIILSYYYINYNPKLFVKLLTKNENPRFQITSDNLIKNRKIFKNFSSEIINFDILDEATNLDDIYQLFLLVPDIPELIKIMSDHMTYIKFCSLAEIEKKIVNFYKIVKPKKEDDLQLLNDSFDNLCKLVLIERYSPFILVDDLFFGYCELYYEKELNKIEQVIKLYKKNCKIFPQEFNENTYEELYNYYHETGLFLIKSGKLVNQDLVKFVESEKLLFNKEIKITEEIKKCLIPSNDESFIDYLLNLKDNSLLELSRYYFNNFTLKDFLIPSIIKIIDCKNNIMIKYCFEGLKNAWLKEKATKINLNLYNFIAQLLNKYFITYNLQEEIIELQKFEDEINNPHLFMDIYAIILLKLFKNSHNSELKKHIYEFIEKHYIEVEYQSIYYKVLIIDEDEQENFLINNLTLDYAIKLEDYIEYPNKVHPRINLYYQLYRAKFFLNHSIQNTPYYKACINTKNNISSLNYKYAINVSKNLQDFFNLFLYFLPNRMCEEEDYLIANLLFDFNDQVDFYKNKYNSLKKILIYFKHFFKTKKNQEIISLEELIQELDNTPIKDFSKLEIKIDSFLVDINEAERNDKLFNSFFFMGLYSKVGDIFPPEEEDEKFKYCLMQFNELNVLGINSETEYLPKELENQLVELVYKNKDRLDDELDFIKEYFNFEDNPNYDIHRIKKSFLDKVNNYQVDKNLGDYQFEFDNFNLFEEKPNINNNIESSTINTTSKKTKKEETNEGGFSIFGNDEEDDEGFSLFGKDEIKEEKNEIKIEKKDIQKIENNNIVERKTIIKEEESNDDQIKIILEDINLKLNDYYYIYRIIKSFDDMEDNASFNEKYYDFFWQIFTNIKKYDTLTNKQFYENVINVSMKIFLSGIGIDYFKNENNNKNEMYLIYEFFEILELYKKYNLLNKQKLFKIIEKLVEYKKNEDDEVINIIRNLENLFTEIGENIQKKSTSNLFIRILCLEKNKINIEEFNRKLIDFSFRNDNNFLFNDIIPLLDEIFKDEIKNKMNILDDINAKDKYILFQESRYEPIENALNNSKEPKISKDLEETILYYFESKIFHIFSKMKKEFENKRDFYQNEDMKDNLRKCLLLLEDEYFKQLNIKNKKLSIFYNIAFIKCFLNDYIYNLYNFNQEMGNGEDINENIIKGNGNNPFRTSIKLYVLKLFYNLIGNYTNFIDFNFGNYQIYYFQEKEIKSLSNFEEINNMNNINNKICGFDSLFIPLKQEEFKEFINIEKNMVNLCQNLIQENDDLINSINNINNLDILLCSIINTFISNFKDKYYFDTNAYKNISAFLFNNINNNRFIKIKYLSKDILLLFIDIKRYENRVLKNENMSYGIQSFSYNQILSISIGLRFVFNTVLFNNQNSLLYQLLIGSNNMLSNNNMFIQYYNQEYTSYKQRNINQLTFSIIRYIIFSHIYFGFLLNKITMSNINDIFINLEENTRLIDVIENELNFIKKILELKGIKDIIIFMNYVFNDIKSIIVDIYLDKYNELSIISMETKIENEIYKYLENFSYYIDEHNKMIEKIGINNNVLFKNNEFKKLITEEKKFYNENKIENKYPFIIYLTLTNFCGMEDFKNQFLYLVNDKNNYPLINCLINNDEIITISKNLPFINDFFNEINNELMMKIRSDDINKNIDLFLSENIKGIFNEYNDKINEINNLKSTKMENIINEINNNTKILDVINIKDNSINKVFNNFIKIYNDFLTSTKIYKDNKNIIKSIIIQEATKNDFINFEINNNENNARNETSIYDRFNELLYLYSKRNRYHKNELNVYNKGKINYDLTQIENILEKEYLFGKKPFKLEQRNFIFSNEVFSDDRKNILDEFINKYPQEEIKDEMMKADFDKFIIDDNKTKNDFQKIYVSLQYMIFFLVKCDINFSTNDKKYSLDYIGKVIRKRNYLLNDLLLELFNNYGDNIGINNLLFLYERVEIKYFDYIFDEIKNNNIDVQGNFNYIKEYFNTNNKDLLLNEEIIIDGFKKYIMVYSFGDNQNKDEILKKIDINKIFEKKCIWHFILINEEQKSKFGEEVNRLLNLNGEENNLIKYVLNKLFISNKKLEEKKKKEKQINDDLLEDDDENEGRRTRIRKRRKRRMEY